MMIDMAGALPFILARLRKCPLGDGLDLRTYKRDRSVLVMRSGEDAYLVNQNGFERERFDSDGKGLKKLIKNLLKREFPRSRKIRVQPVEGARKEMG